MSLSRHRAVRTTALVAAAVTAGVMLVPPVASVAEAAAEAPHTTGPPSVTRVTLVTGDVVEVSSGADGKQSVVILPRPDGTVPQAAITRARGHLYVVPTEAFGLLEANRLDRDLFDVTTLIESKYDDASRATLPVIVDYGTGRPAAAESRQASLTGATRTVSVPELGMTGFHAKKKDARAFWDDLTTGADAAGNPTALSDGAARVDLDGRVETALEHSVPQIHAPQAWAAGFDGAGTTVAVLDTGYDQTHPDLAGRVGTSANFTTDATVKDGNGHGTHVASTVGGTGAASDGLRKGVAPKTSLMVGKVLADGGWGEDSWVLAGMVWAVDQGADVVSMSLGGDADDGTSPLAQAINELSATSDTLFVVAAGNNGSGPSTVTTPGSADAALTVGAVDVNDTMAPFSSRGPRLRNGALKPEVVAPGVNITAARAAGTQLGPIVDESYTTISGTSMATPHVAGLAALVKQEHPDWDGDQIKSVIANSAVPVAHASGFDAGTGRVDALAAIHQTVLAPATLTLGSYAWPYSDLSSTRTALTYTNTADTAVTLSLALAGEDGSPETTGSMSLADDHVTVPAGGTASVDVVLDPTIASPGAYSAIVTATPDNGGGTVRTGVAYQLENAAYDVKVTVKPRTGSLSASHAISLNSYGAPWVFEQRHLDASSGAQSATFRVPPGTYSTSAVSAGLAADGATEGVVSYEPSFTVSKNTEIVLDENETGLFGYDVARPVVTDAAALSVAWQGAAGYTEFTYYGAADRIYARPSAGLGGAATVASNWWLSQPQGVLSPAEGQPLALRSLPSADGTTAPTAPAEIDGSFKIVNAGRAAAPNTSAVKGAVAVVSGTCDDLTAVATALKKAGAAAMVAYPGPGQECAGTIDGTVGLPSLQARAIDAADLLPTVRNARAGLVTHEVPEYMYDLVRYWKDEVPKGGTVDGTAAATAALVEHYNGMGSTSADGLLAGERLIGWIPGRGSAIYGMVHPVPFPATVTHYASTAAAWERSVSGLDAKYGGEYAYLWAPRTAYKAGTTNRDTWFGGPISTRVSPLNTVDSGNPPPTREGNWVYLYAMGAYVDAAGHIGQSDSGYTGRVYADDKLVLTAPISSWMAQSLSPGTHRLRVVTEAQRENLFWRQATEVKTTWEFDSEPATGPYVVLPMLNISYQLPELSSTNAVPAGEYAFGVAFSMPDTVEMSPVVKRSVEISWDGGQTWGAAKLTKCGDTSCKAHVTNQPGGQASMRVSATDAAGRTVSQEVVKAYAVQ